MRLAVLGDNMEFMATLEDNAFDLLIDDIPYGKNVGKMAYLQEKGSGHVVRQKNGSKLKTPNNVYTLKEWDKVVPPQAYFDEARRVSKHQIIWGVNYVDWVGLGSGRIKWDKGVAEGASFSRYEYAYCSLIEGEVELPLLWAGMFQAKSLREPMVQQGNKRLNEKRRHPTQKPVMLYQRLLLDYAQLGWIILDNHFGSGNLGIACESMGFDYTICEIDPEYYHAGVRAIKDYTSQQKLFTI